MIINSILLLLASAVVVGSPSGNNSLQFELNADGTPVYSVCHCGESIVSESRLGFELRGNIKNNSMSFGDDGSISRVDSNPVISLSDGFELVSSEDSSFDDTWYPVWGEESQIRNNFNELLACLRHKSSGALMNIRFRVFDDGVGFRYEFPGGGPLKKFVIKDELTEFNMTGDHLSWWIPGDFDSQEYQYTSCRLSEIPEKMKGAIPALGNRVPYRTDAVQTAFLMQTRDGRFITVHEAALIDYPCANLLVRGNSLRIDLVPDAQGWKGNMETDCRTPWRTIQIADKATDLLASRLILNLNEPCALDDVSWIRPCKYMGVWWEMICNKSKWRYEGGKHGATNENVRKYIDFAADNGFGAVLVEGWNTGWENWSDPTKEEVFDFVTPYPDFDIAALNVYAQSKGIKLIMHHETSSSVRTYERQMDKAYSLMNQYGYDAVKSGYVGNIFPRGEYHFGQWMVNHYLYAVKEAARHHIMVNAHEAVRPTGLCRAYPNLICNESAAGTEYQAFGGLKPGHTSILPFTRLNGGPMDYTPGIFFMNLKEWSGAKSHVNSTICGQLGLYVTMYSPLQMAADTPEHYSAHMDAFQFIKDVAVDWSESRYLFAQPMEFIIVARKAKATGEWFCGGVCDGLAREFTIPLDFLDSGHKYIATIYCDAPDADCYSNEYAYQIKDIKVTNKKKLTIHMAPGGGFAMRIREY